MEISKQQQITLKLDVKQAEALFVALLEALKKFGDDMPDYDKSFIENLSNRLIRATDNGDMEK